ncbi:MAG: exodeoxyribonuclease VII large subunit [Pseudomonadota bacterium]
MNTSNAVTLTPSALNRQVRTLLESHFDLLWVEGEVSNFAAPASGHWYFTLKDDSAQVRCAMFRNRNSRLRFRPANGDQVRLRARVSLYEGRGEFQLLGEFMEPSGAGALQARFEALRDKLQQEGLFASERKQPLPKNLEHLAVITSPSGAALQDILQVLARRNPSIEISVIGSSVQGDAAAAQLTSAVRYANRLAETGQCRFDAILLARGGGSLEDLWAFNDEKLAREIAASKLPTVAGVGHEVDATIADFAADVRAPTPSAAAELLSDDRHELAARLDERRLDLQKVLARIIGAQQGALGYLRLRIKHPLAQVQQKMQSLDDQTLRLERAAKRHLDMGARHARNLHQRLRLQAPGRRLHEQNGRLVMLNTRLNREIRQQLTAAGDRVGRQAMVLNTLSPLAVLNRGYAIVTNSSGQALRSVEDAQLEETVDARLASGSLKLAVKEKLPGNGKQPE